MTPASTTVAISDIDTTKNIRTDVGDVNELAQSISEHGVLEPVILTTKRRGSGYVAVAGHRRIAAATAAGLDVVPAIVHDTKTKPERTVWMLVENLQREDLDPLDEAKGYRQLVAAGYSQKRIAEEVSRSKAHVSKRLRLLELPIAVQNRVRRGDISIDDGYELARLAGAGAAGDRIRELAERRYDIPNAVRSELDQLKWVAKAAERAETLAATGVRVAAGEALSGSLGIDIDVHAAQPCHATMVRVKGWGDDRLEELAVCSDPDRHTTDGEAPLDHDGWFYRDRLTDEEREAERAAYEVQRAAETAATEERLTAVTAGLEALSSDDAVEWLVRDAATSLIPDYVYGEWPGPGIARLIALADIDPSEALGDGSKLKPSAKRKLAVTVATADIGDLARAVAAKTVPQAARYANPNPGPTRDLIARLVQQ